VFNPSPFVNQYQSASTLGCTPSARVLFAAADDAPDGTHGPAPDALERLDPAFLCADRIAPQSSGVRIKGLQNGIPYVIGVTSVDKNGNASPIIEAILQRPIPTRDFYNGYRQAGGAAEGGYCALARGGRVAGAAEIAVGGALLMMAARRRRRRRIQPERP
jgi:hypothetical protein